MGRARVRRSSEEWKEIIDRQKVSGLSRVRFCRREGIGRSTFEKWAEKLRSEPDAGFVELAARATRSEPWVVEVELPGGIVLRVRG